LKQRLRSAALLPLSYPDESSTVGRRCLQANKSNVEIEKTAANTSTEETHREGATDVLPTVTLSLTEVNPFKPLLLVLRRTNNFLILLSSGLFRFLEAL
jgi:hypothetical protein